MNIFAELTVKTEEEKTLQPTDYREHADTIY
jgi:hypothetical protein